MRENYFKREPREFNIFRSMFQWITCNCVYAFFYKMKCGFDVFGRENVPKKGFFIVASNHVSAIDPFLVVSALQRPIAYMAKQELFEKPIMRLFLDLLGAFAVNREKLGVSTIKTALGIKKTDWVLGLFPQGTREKDGNLDNVTRGFAGLAKSLKCDILPLGITGALKSERKNFRNHITIKIGKPIPYNDNTTEMVELWKQKIAELTAGEEDEKDN